MELCEADIELVIKDADKIKTRILAGKC